MENNTEQVSVGEGGWASVGLLSVCSHRPTTLTVQPSEIEIVDCNVLRTLYVAALWRVTKKGQMCARVILRREWCEGVFFTHSSCPHADPALINPFYQLFFCLLICTFFHTKLYIIREDTNSIDSHGLIVNLNHIRVLQLDCILPVG